MSMRTPLGGCDRPQFATRPIIGRRSIVIGQFTMTPLRRFQPVGMCKYRPFADGFAAGQHGHLYPELPDCPRALPTGCCRMLRAGKRSVGAGRERCCVHRLGSGGSAVHPRHGVVAIGVSYSRPTMRAVAAARSTPISFADPTVAAADDRDVALQLNRAFPLALRRSSGRTP
jgi:hypothetical protein